jgi:hypothetical protein
MDVYAYYKKATLNVFVERFAEKNNGEFIFFTFYDESRLVDSFKDVLWNNRLSVIQAIDITNVEEKVFAKLEEKGFITSDRKILNQEALIRLVTLIGDENLDDFVKTEAEKNLPKEGIRERLGKRYAVLPLSAGVERATVEGTRRHETLPSPLSKSSATLWISMFL